MNSKVIEDQLVSLVKQYVPAYLKESDIHRSSNLKDDLYVDSLSLISLVIDIENYLGVYLSNNLELYTNKLTFGNLLKVVLMEPKKGKEATQEEI